MDFSTRLSTIKSIGRVCRSAASGLASGQKTGALFREIKKAGETNPWFTLPNIGTAFNAWAKALEEQKAERWAGTYPRLEKGVSKPLTIGIVMAGNIPLVGMHDLLCVLMSGHRAVIKLSSDDAYLLPAVLRELETKHPHVSEQVTFTEGRLENFDAVIATGSNNTSRYFDYYFSRYPNIIRRNRNSIAVLKGNESKSELKSLGSDIFTYFGLGCRNVSKIFIPESLQPADILDELEGYKDAINHHKYANNYDYRKAILMINRIPYLDNGFLLLKEDTSFFSPISVLHYERYRDISQVRGWITENSEQIQCVVTNIPDMTNAVPLGKSQFPELWDYADNADVMEFLLAL